MLPFIFYSKIGQDIVLCNYSKLDYVLIKLKNIYMCINEIIMNIDVIGGYYE
ncbi:hypothetical protein CNEO3_340003 [Clostridium neonatale]|nr:hypothetical protein CNEO3_340003 [Clostridium neonatale]